MSSIIRLGDTSCHGISVESRGVFTNSNYGYTYAGQCKDGYACGLGVLTWPDGHKAYAEHGPDGQFDGRNLDRTGLSSFYYLYERGERKDSASVWDGGCTYNDVACARDDPRLLALIAQVAPVEVRPAAPIRHRYDTHTHTHLPIVRCPARFAPQALATAVATEVHPTPHAGLCNFAISFGLGRPRKPWPTCRCAWRCACTAATQV